ncbi:hypothetical protein LOY46_17330 [Pseudomonas sichuanensis]|uniref:hypothetical protein n=1 Tax=Pseudomonas sichuanensis TaxID=2213015 RepID=UPI00215F0157|nr:hypothetical protein [Pseudomonas sichuanensis]UVK81327.1 hypothetical protein LOY46_17330 [Pseudomonas sichuanensis]
MAEYLVRVELFNANAEEYNQLHEQLGTLGLFRQIRADNGVYYDMPSGTYFGESGLGPAELQVRVSREADRLSHPRAASVFVARLTDWQSSLHQS